MTILMIVGDKKHVWEKWLNFEMFFPEWVPFILEDRQQMSTMAS